jgi:hypothetical protein
MILNDAEEISTKKILLVVKVVKKAIKKEILISKLYRRL